MCFYMMFVYECKRVRIKINIRVNWLLKSFSWQTSVWTMGGCRVLPSVDCYSRCGCTSLPVEARGQWWQTEQHLQFLSSLLRQSPTKTTHTV